ncbi:MAG: dihydroorotate dehydrogenase electron transfer subunit [Syntrophomonadaceae bacterium]|nr:dihydroorotate dehydrogenase electron transfer subunit [Syntrophomonadaceae bacterium]
MPVQTMASIIENKALGGGLWLLEAVAPGLVAEATPGQFVQVRVSPQADPLLRRPISIFDADKDTGVLRLLYRAVGRGTLMMTALRPGETLDVMGPLGRGFALDIAAGHAALVGGGVGCAPLLYLGKALLARGCRVSLYGGAATAAGLSFAEHFTAAGITLHPATDDGTLGHHGLITDLFFAGVNSAATEGVYCCGPAPMMAAVAAHCRRLGLRAQFSLEQHMACGVGACLGCACKLKSEDEGYAKICKDGPVFDLEQLGWGREGGNA